MNTIDNDEIIDFVAKKSYLLLKKLLSQVLNLVMYLNISHLDSQNTKKKLIKHV